MNLDDYIDVESPSKRLRLTRHEPIQTLPPSTPARASPARGPRAGRGRRRPSKPTNSPSCLDKWLKWPPTSPSCPKEAQMQGLVTERSRWTAREGTQVGTAPLTPRLTRGRQSMHSNLWLGKNSDNSLESTVGARGETTGGSTQCPSSHPEGGHHGNLCHRRHQSATRKGLLLDTGHQHSQHRQEV